MANDTSAWCSAILLYDADLSELLDGPRNTCYAYSMTYYGMKYSDEEREWMRTHPATAVPAWRPTAGTVLSANAVNGMTADAQWSYKADSATPKLRVKGLSKFPCDANELAAFEAGRRVKPRRQSTAARIKAELAAANARIAELEGILSAVRMELAA